MGIIGLDRKPTDANPALCRIYRRTREELIGMNGVDVTLPDDNPEAARLFNELLTGQVEGDCELPPEVQSRVLSHYTGKFKQRIQVYALHRCKSASSYLQPPSI